MTKFTFGLGSLGLAVLLLNSVGVGFDANFDLYYACLLLTLVVGFALVADVATRES